MFALVTLLGVHVQRTDPLHGDPDDGELLGGPLRVETVQQARAQLVRRREQHPSHRRGLIRLRLPRCHHKQSLSHHPYQSSCGKDFPVYKPVPKNLADWFAAVSANSDGGQVSQ